MGGRGKNNSKKRAATLDGEQGDDDTPNFDLEVSTEPNVTEDPVLWHNHMFPLRNTPKGRLVQWHGWEFGVAVDLDPPGRRLDRLGRGLAPRR